MSWTSYNYVIELIAGNGPPVRATATRQHIADGVLHLFYRSGPGVPYEDHVGSWPLTSIRSWKREESR